MESGMLFVFIHSYIFAEITRVEYILFYPKVHPIQSLGPLEVEGYVKD